MLVSISLRAVSCTLLLCGSVAAQVGQGFLGSSGREPALSWTGLEAGAPSVLFVRDLTPLTGPSLVLLVSGAPGFVPLDSFGLFGASLGLGLLPTDGFLATPPIPVGASGTFQASLTVPVAALGTTLYLQAVHADPAAGPLGVALSDGLAVTLGGSAAGVVFGRQIGPDSWDLEHRNGDGVTSGPLAFSIRDCEFDVPRLTTMLGTIDLRRGAAAIDLSAPDRPRLAIEGRGALYLYEVEGTPRAGVFFVREGTGQVDWHLETVRGISADIAVAAGGDRVAILEDPDGTTPMVHVLRTDGTNWPGSTSRLRTAPAPGLDIAETSLTFIAGTLHFTDGEGLFRVSNLGLAQVLSVPLPLSGGQVPGDTSLEIAVSDDGNTGALLAGQSSSENDVYALGANGAVTNVTNDPADHGSVGYGSTQGGGVLALSPDGSKIAFTKTVADHREMFVRDTGATTPALAVTANSFLSTAYIEAEAPIFFLSNDRLIFAVGVSTSQVDLYEAHAAGANFTVSNVTGSSGILQAPFGLGSTLTVLDIVRTPVGGVVYRMDGGPNLQCLSGAVDPSGPAQVLVDGFLEVVGASALGTGTVFGLNGPVPRLVHLSAAAATTPLLSLTSSDQILAVHTNASAAAGLALVQVGGFETFHRVTASAAVPLPLPGQTAGRTAAFLSPSRVLVDRESPQGGHQIFGIDLVTGASTLLATEPVAVLFF